MGLPVPFLETIEWLTPCECCFDDPLLTLVLGTGASFYRLIPKLVLRVESEDEVAAILSVAYREQVPVIFRVVGTSLSGQVISDSVLLVLGDNRSGREIRADGVQIRLQPGIIGAQANAWLASFGRKVGPDPTSINAYKIGGIVVNSASGMCCDTAQNSYHTLVGLRLLLADGTRLDSEDPASVATFRASHGELPERLTELGCETRANAELATKIRHKYRLKNTIGLSLDMLVDYDEPLDTLTHLMVDSEGTLGFISAVTYDIVLEHPHKASALSVLPMMETCCTAAAVFKRQPVSVVELLDRRSPCSVENMQGMPEWVKSPSTGACVLLIESRTASRTLLYEQLGRIMASIVEYPPEKQVDFNEDSVTYNWLWHIRKDTSPAVGAVRKIGTTVITEDVTFLVERLAEGVNRLIELFGKHRHDKAILFGHALEGNLHFVFTQGFDLPEQIARYSAFMDDVAHLVAVGCGGSLKVERGTGRNMAPSVELERGEDTYRLMWQLKHLLDPCGILNPGVVPSDDPQSHLKNPRPLSVADEIVDECIECGFCEPACPPRGLTFTPRQRIIPWRDIQAKKRAGVDTTALERDYRYQDIDTCVATGLCAQRCPVNINTDKLIRKLRGAGARHAEGATWLARNFAGAMRAARFALLATDTARRPFGVSLLANVSRGLSQTSGGRVPQWTSALSQPVRLTPPPIPSDDGRPKVVYLVACVSRAMGPVFGDEEREPLLDKTRRLLEKAGYQMVFPDNLDNLCYGQPFASKGYTKQTDDKRDELLAVLSQASRGGLDSIYCDTSPCIPHLAQNLDDPRLQIHDPMKFIRSYLLDRLESTPQDKPVAVHVTCSTQYFDESQALIDLVGRCTREVVIPGGIHCCGFAGNKGFITPELNAHSLRSLEDAVQFCEEGVPTSRTCEIGLSEHGGIDYRRVAYLVDRVTQVKGTSRQGEQPPRGYPSGHAPQKRRIAPLALSALRQAKWVFRRRRSAPGRAKNPSLNIS